MNNDLALQALLRLLQGTPNTNYRVLGPPKPNTWSDPTTWYPPPTGPSRGWAAAMPTGDPITSLLGGILRGITGSGTPLAPGPPPTLNGRMY